MLARLLIILVLVSQPLLALSIGASLHPMADASGDCCRVVVPTTCCDESVAQQSRGMTIETCDCGITPGKSQPAPDAPMPSQSTQRVVAVPASLPGIDVTYSDDSFSILRWYTSDLVPGHNRARALLGIWQT